jgi:hypothetical protein
LTKNNNSNSTLLKKTLKDLKKSLQDFNMNSQAQNERARSVNNSVSPDGTDASVYHVSNQTVIAKKKGNKSIVAVKKTNKTSGVSEPSADKEVDDTVRELQAKIKNENTSSKSPKKYHMIKVHVNLTLDNKALPFAKTVNSIKNAFSNDSSEPRVS